MSQVDLIAAAREVVGPGPDMDESLAGTPAGTRPTPGPIVRVPPDSA